MNKQVKIANSRDVKGNNKWMKSFVIGSCAAVMFSGTAFAANANEPMASIQIEPELSIQIEPEAVFQIEPDAAFQIEPSAPIANPDISYEWKELHRQIDQLLFHEYAEQLKEKGINVTLTGLNGDYIEIGIDPYKEDHAQYLEQLLAEYPVQVIEMKQAYTLGPAIVDTGNAAVSGPALDPDQPVSSGVVAYSEEMLELHAQVDRFLFQDHAEQLKEQEITVTHTSPGTDYVEIGILDYSNEKAAYIYEQLGNDKINVVEGEQAVLYAADASQGAGVSNAMIAEGAMEATATASEQLPAEQSSNSALFAGAAAALAALGGGLIALRNRLFGRS